MKDQNYQGGLFIFVYQFL